MMSAYDPWVNMLRTTVAAFAAGVGGADAVTVLPFDSPLGRPDAFGRRIARNTSSLLISESHLARVADPAGGAYAVEKLTDDLAVAAWELFGRLDEGEDLEPLIEATVAERDRQVATRKRPLTGLTEFPNLGEERPQREPDPYAPEVRRYGAAFEALRDEPAAGAGLPRDDGHRRRAHRARDVRRQPAGRRRRRRRRGGRRPRPRDDLVAAYDGQAVVCLAGQRRGVRRVGRRGRGRPARGRRDVGGRRGQAAATDADDSCAMGVDALAFLARTREKLA